MDLVWYSSAMKYAATGSSPAVEIERITTEPIRFSVKDSKGREIGAYAVLERRVHWHNMEPKLLDGYKLSTRALRDARTFGAIPRGTYVATLEEGKALAVKKIEEARKRAVKKAAKEGA